jgi:hypothetical protein
MFDFPDEPRDCWTPRDNQGRPLRRPQESFHGEETDGQETGVGDEAAGDEARQEETGGQEETG